MGEIPTGVPNLDIVLRGGLPESCLAVVAGGPGTGKATLVQQIAYHHAAGGGRVLYVAALTEAHSTLVAHLQRFRFFDPALLGESIKIINVFPVTRQGLGAVTSTILRALRYERAPFLVFDGFRSLRDMFSDVREVRAFAYELAGTLSSIRATALFTSEFSIAQIDSAPEALVADTIIVLSSWWDGSRCRRTLDVVKMRAGAAIKGPHAFEIGPAGVELYPRLEAVYPGAAGPLPGGRSAWGIPELDAVLGGGVPRGSSTLLGGPTGIGKTTFALQFALAGTQAGEGCLYLTTAESEQRLAAKAEALELGLDDALGRGMVRVVPFPSMDCCPDRMAWQLSQVAAEGAVRRVVIDGLEQVAAGVAPARGMRYFSALAVRLAELGVTTLATARVEGWHDLPAFASAFDNVLLGRLVVEAGELRRFLMVTKMRDSAHDLALRQFSIGPGGIRLAPRGGGVGGWQGPPDENQTRGSVLDG